MTKEEVDIHVEKCARSIYQEYGSDPVILVCILKGSAWFFVDLTRILHRMGMPDYTTYFIEASSYKNEQIQQEQVEILSRIVPSKFLGRKVVLVDELYDNGETMENLKIAITEQALVPYQDIRTCALFKKSKPEGHSYPGCLEWFGTLVPNVWLVGCGLDHEQKMRGCEDLYAVPKAEGIPQTPDDEKIFG